MKLLENYSANLRARIDRPIAFPSFYPGLPEKYIVLCLSSGMQGKNYPFWDVVLQFLAPELEKRGYNIVQIGGKDDPLPENVKVMDSRGKTDVRQLYYIVQHASLSLSVDTFLVHVASFYDIPLVSLYGLTSSDTSGPEFGTPSKQILLEPDREKFPPTYNPQDGGPISHIKIEDVISAVDKLLDLDMKIPEILFTGSRYNQKMIEVIPDHLVPPQFCNIAPLFRMDYLFNEEILAKNLINLKCSITTDREININLLAQFRQNIPYMQLEVNEKIDVKYIKAVKKLGINLALFTRETKSEKINQLKFLFFEEALVHQLPFQIRPECLWNVADFAGYKYKTKRVLACKDGFCHGKAQWEKGIFSKDIQNNEGDVIDNPDFWADSDYVIIYR